MGEARSPTLAEIEQARERIRGIALRTPLVRLNAPEAGREIDLKLESLQPIGSFKIRAGPRPRPQRPGRAARRREGGGAAARRAQPPGGNIDLDRFASLIAPSA
jgi:threonine dehydratase